MNIKDATITIVENFPHQLVRCEIIQDKQSDTLFIRKDLFASAVAEFIAEHNYVKAAAEPPVPRPLSSLTDAECAELYRLATNENDVRSLFIVRDDVYIQIGYGSRHGKWDYFDGGLELCNTGEMQRYIKVDTGECDLEKSEPFNATRVVRYLDSLGIALG